MTDIMSIHVRKNSLILITYKTVMRNQIFDRLYVLSATPESV